MGKEDVYMSDMLLITSKQNPKIKGVCALAEKRDREAARLFRFDGVKLLIEAIEKGVEIDSVYIRESSFVRIRERLGERFSLINGDRIILVGDSVFEKMSLEKAPEGVITVAKHIDKIRKITKIENVELPKAQECVFLAESLQDPGNLGTLIRSAAALGIDRVVVSADSADVYNPKTIRAAMGGLFYISVDRVEQDVFSEYIGALQAAGRRVFAAALDDKAETLDKLALQAGDCFVIGNEGHGLTSETIDACDGSVIIPMRDEVESLNAAAAAVILMWEMKKALG